MLRFRLLLAWLLLAALPLQGWAAATMLFCGPAQRAAVVAKAPPHGEAVSHHDMHAAHHDMQAVHAQHHMDTGHAGSAGDGAQPVADGSHTCGVCAACCHGVALAQTQQWPAASPAPRADLIEPLVAVVARPSPVPDKPPRA
ncbi:MAG: hypothetical protein Q8R01_17330 [Ramlibacter sp.]|nr:hypothetical protein [Ramlibacter sp.]